MKRKRDGRTAVALMILRELISELDLLGATPQTLELDELEQALQRGGQEAREAFLRKAETQHLDVRNVKDPDARFQLSLLQVWAFASSGISAL